MKTYYINKKGTGFQLTQDATDHTVAQIHSTSLLGAQSAFERWKKINRKQKPKTNEG